MRVESVEIGASGTVRMRTDGGSLILFRQEYLGIPSAHLPARGDELGEETLAAIEAARESYEAEVKALELLARAEHTRYLLSLKLVRRGIPDRAIRAALDYLEGRRLLDDERYARAWAEERIRKRGEGPSRLVSGLTSRGVAGDLARRVTAELLAGEARQEALARSLARLLKSGRGGGEKAVRRLREEGWKPSEITAALESINKGSE